jgi:predicted CoA-binding protein
LKINNPVQNEICKILSISKKIAVFGLSRHENRTSRRIADFLVSKNYEVVGINPVKPIISEIPVFARLDEVPFKIDIVNVFRRSEDIPHLIPDILLINPKVLWLQLGIRNDEAVQAVIEKGIIVIQDKCILIEHNACFR